MAVIAFKVGSSCLIASRCSCTTAVTGLPSSTACSVEAIEYRSWLACRTIVSDISGKPYGFAVSCLDEMSSFNHLRSVQEAVRRIRTAAAVGVGSSVPESTPTGIEITHRSDRESPIASILNVAGSQMFVVFSQYNSLVLLPLWLHQSH